MYDMVYEMEVLKIEPEIFEGESTISNIIMPDTQSSTA